MEDFNLFKEKLQISICVFEYKKSNGEIRRAIGTLCKDLIPPQKSIYDRAISLIKSISESKDILSDYSKVNVFVLANKFLQEIEDSQSSKKQNDNVQVYYDFEASQFRCFTKTNFIKTI